MNRIRQRVRAWGAAVPSAAEQGQGAAGVLLIGAGVWLAVSLGAALIVLGLALVLGALFDTFLGDA